MTKRIALTEFARRHFTKEFAGTKVTGLSEEELVEIANRALEKGVELQPGYAPFCAHLFIENPEASTTRAGIAAITADNAHLLRSGYQARRPEELAVLGRWFQGLEAPRAEFLDIILYTRAQLEQEDDGKPESERDVPNADWCIVSINAELQPAESPMPPVTMMRNALGREQGGSGHPLDAAAYRRSVEFWEAHAVVK